MGKLSKANISIEEWKTKMPTAAELLAKEIKSNERLKAKIMKTVAEAKTLEEVREKIEILIEASNND